MSTPILLIFAAAVCVWALLRCIGNECDRRIRMLEDRIRAEQDAKAMLAAMRDAEEPVIARSIPGASARSAANKPATAARRAA